MSKDEIKTKRVRRNVEKQEALVSALYKFSYNLQNNEHDCKSQKLDGSQKQTIHIPSVGIAMDEIMEIFGYVVTPIN